jgi:hypothetical protein
MAGEVITWHLDPTVAEWAVFGRFTAELRFTCEGDDWGWAVFSRDDPADEVSYPVAHDTTAGYEAAKSRAGAAMRRLETDRRLSGESASRGEPSPDPDRTAGSTA